MNVQAISNTMLVAYKDLERYCEAVDYKIRKVRERSMRGDIYELFDTMQKLINEKIAYCNTKVIIDEAVANTNSRTVKGFYIAGRTPSEMADEYGLTVKEIYEELQQQKKAVADYIAEHYKADDLIIMLNDSKRLMNIYRFNP